MLFNVAVTYPPEPADRQISLRYLENIATVRYLSDFSATERKKILKKADVLVAMSFSQSEIGLDELQTTDHLRFIQLLFSGADNVPFDSIPENVLIATNPGAFARPIAEHVLGMTLALAKSLLPKHRALSMGHFDQSGLNKELNGKVCGIIGLGGNGKAIANIMCAIGMKVYGISSSGRTDIHVDFIGTGADLEKVLKLSDVIVLSVPLTRHTHHLIGRRELRWMKPDAILINVARGSVVDQRALYRHLSENESFGAGIDTWWSEPDANGAFRLEHPFFDLPNLIGSPHVADHVPGTMSRATEKAVENVKRFLLNGNVYGILDPSDYRVKTP